MKRTPILRLHEDGLKGLLTRSHVINDCYEVGEQEKVDVVIWRLRKIMMKIQKNHEQKRN